jgi:hypothetical protein
VVITAASSLFSGADAVFQVRPPAPVPLSAAHDRKGPQAGSSVAAQSCRHRRLRKLSVGTFREHANAGGGTHETVERLRVSSDLTRQVFRRFGSAIDEVRDTELREATAFSRDAVPG